MPTKKIKPKSFEYYWNVFYQDVSKRENFKETHRVQVEILCNLYVEMHHLEDIIKLEGYTYISEGRNGHQVKVKPEVQQLNRVRAEIRAYCRMLGLLLVKDTASGQVEDEDEWD